MKHSGAAPLIRESSLLAAHSYLPRICSICILFLVVLSSVGASKTQSSVDLDTVAGKKQVTIVTNLPRGKVGIAYSGSVSINGTSLRYQYSVSSGALPTGLRLNANTGAVSGTPTKAETAYFELRATRTSGAAASLQTQITSVNTSTSPDTCGPPTYNCSRSDSSFVPLPRTKPSWGGLIGTNKVVNDPDFNNPIVRVTDGTSGRPGYRNNCTGLGGSGDVPQVWNSNSTILLICDDGGAYFPIGFDPVNFVTTGPIYGTNPVYTSNEGVFSHTNPNIFYEMSGGQLKVIDYTNRSVRPTPQLLYDFANCGVGTVKWQSQGGSDPTDTVFSVGFSTTGAQNTGTIVAVYNSSTGICFKLDTSSGVIKKYPGAVRVGTINLPDRFTIHNVKMKGGTTLVVSPWNCITACGAPPYAWVIGTTEMYGLGSPRGGGHWAVGCRKWLNQPGDLYEYDVSRNYSSPTRWSTVWPVPRSECGALPKQSCVAPFDSHPAWLGDCSDTGPVCMATVSLNDSITYPYQNEIICFTTDGSNRQIRFAHTYSSMALQGFDAQWSIGAPSQDGRFYAWTTKAGGQFGCTNGTLNCALTSRRSDVLVVKLQ